MSLATALAAAPALALDQPCCDADGVSIGCSSSTTGPESLLGWAALAALLTYRRHSPDPSHPRRTDGIEAWTHPGADRRDEDPDPHERDE